MKDSHLAGLVIAGSIGVGAVALLMQRQSLGGRYTRLAGALAETQVARLDFTVTRRALTGSFSGLVYPSGWHVGAAFDVGELMMGDYTNTSLMGATFRARIIDLDMVAPNNIVAEEYGNPYWLDAGASTRFGLPSSSNSVFMPDRDWHLELELLMYT